MVLDKLTYKVCSLQTPPSPSPSLSPLHPHAAFKKTEKEKRNSFPLHNMTLKIKNKINK